MELNIHQHIIEAAKKGDRKAQKQLYELYAKAMYNVCLRMLRDTEKSQDCLQEAFIDAFTNLNKFDFRVAFGAWLKRLVINRCINELKRNQRSMEFIDSIEDDVYEEIEVEEKALQVQAIKLAMQELPAGSRAIFSMYLIEGYDHVEISQVLQISESTSKSQYMRAKQRIKRIIQNQAI